MATRTATRKDYVAWAAEPLKPGPGITIAASEARARVVLSGADLTADERWHAATYVRPHGADVLDALGLGDVPTNPAGWCNCPATSAESEAA